MCLAMYCSQTQVFPWFPKVQNSYTFWNDPVFGGLPAHVTLPPVCLQAKAGARTLASSLMDVRLLEHWRVFQLAKHEKMMETLKPLSCT